MLKKNKKELYGYIKKTETTRWFTYICEDGNRKFVRQYKRDTSPMHGYPRTVPQSLVLILLDETKIKHSMLLQNNREYIDEEYIVGVELDINKEKETIINTVIDYINEMIKVDCSSIKKYISWKNNDEHLKFLVNHIVNIYEARENVHECYEKLNITKESIESLLENKLDNKRKLSLIHGDLHTGNMIKKDNDIYVIDWELGTLGDLAYELATHFILMKYGEEEKNIYYDEICKRNKIDKDRLINDVKVYTIFEYYRRVILKVFRIDKFISENKDYEKLLEEVYPEYLKLCELTNREIISKEDLKTLF